MSGENYKIKPVLLGERDYIHSTTLFEALLKAVFHWDLGAVFRIKASFNSVLRNPADLLLLDDNRHNTGGLEQYPARFIVETEKGDSLIVVQPNGAGDLIREPYNETILVEKAVLTEKENKIELQIDSIERIVNYIVALNKNLLKKTIDSVDYTSWLMANLSLDWNKIVKLGKGLLLLTLNSTIGYKAARSKILLGNELIGQVLFTREKLK